MNDQERFLVVLDELRGVLEDLLDLARHVVLVGGQVVAVESLARGGEGVIHVSTDTGVELTRGYSLEPDLLFDVDGAGPRAELLIEVLKERRFERIRSARWKKEVDGVAVLIDLFHCTPDEAYIPTGMTTLPSGELALARSRPLTVQLASGDLKIEVPDAVGFFAMKLDAKALRPDKTKDSFDLYVYAQMKGPTEIAEALRSAGDEGLALAKRIRDLFSSVEAAGVRDVLAYAGSLTQNDEALVARAATDLFDEIWRLTTETS